MKIIGSGTAVEKVLSTVYSKEDLVDVENFELEDIMDLVVQFGSMEDFEQYTHEIFDVPLNTTET